MFQRFNLFLWPRATWKQRLLAAVFAAVFVAEVVQQWPHRHDDLALARWIAWGMVVSGSWFGVKSLLVVLTGRLPRTFARILGKPRYASMTFSQIRDDIAREQRAARERTRPL